jgi:hypothetical protein
VVEAVVVTQAAPVVQVNLADQVVAVVLPVVQFTQQGQDQDTQVQQDRHNRVIQAVLVLPMEVGAMVAVVVAQVVQVPMPAQVAVLLLQPVALDIHGHFRV